MWDWIKKTASQAYNSYVKPAVQWVSDKVVKPTVKVVQNVTKSISQPSSNNNRSNNSNSSSSSVWGSANNNSARQETARKAAENKAKTQTAISSAQNIWKNYTNSVSTNKPAWAATNAPKKVDPTAWNNVKKAGAGAWNWAYKNLGGEWLGNNTPLNGVSNILSRWQSSQDISNSLKRQTEDASKNIDRRNSKLQTIQDEANKITSDFESGNINYTNAKSRLADAEARFQAEKLKTEKVAGNYNDYFNKESATLNTPITFNQKGIIPLFSKIWNSKLLGVVTPKAAWEVAAWISNLPNRTMNTVLNAMSNKWDSDNSKGVKVPTYDGSTYKSDPKKNILQNSWNESKNQKNPYWQKIFKDVPNNFGQRPDWTQKNNWTKGVDIVGDAMVDPGSLIPTGTGFKMFDKTTDAVRNSQTGVKIATKWNSSANPIVRGLKWLNQTTDQTAKLKFDKKVAIIQREIMGDFGGVSDKQADLAWIIMRGGKVSASVDPNDVKVANRIVNKWRSKLDEMFRIDEANLAKQGTKLQFNPHYAPGKYGSADDAKKVLEKTFDATPKKKGVPAFAKKKEFFKYSNDVEGITKDLATRTYASRKLDGKLDTLGEKVRKRLANPIPDLQGGWTNPTKIWKASVLGARPSWIINNVSHNIPASVMGGGAGTLKSYGRIARDMLKERKLTPKMLKNMPEEVLGNTMSKEGLGDKLGAFGGWFEGLSRGAMYDNLIRKGMTPAEATKQVNRYLFDYSTTKNWERPIKAVLPFWNWQKNITKFVATMPLNNPRAFKVYKLIKQEFMDKPLSEIPDEIRSYTDPESGKEITWNPRKGYEGKIKIPGMGWRSVPFLPIMPDQLDQIGISPWLRLSEELLTGKDTFGNSLMRDNKILDRILNVFPQTGLIKDYANKDKKTTENWLSTSGYSKNSQGFDPSKPNYDEKLDNNKKWERTRNNYFTGGWGTFKKFDKAKYDDTKNYGAFTKDWFSRDFDKEFNLPKETSTPEERQIAYEKKQAAKSDLAKKYGYDLQKDIYDTNWRKYDTEATRKAKEGLQVTQANKSNFYKTTGEFWKNYSAQTDVAKKIKLLIDNPKYAKKSIDELKVSYGKTLAYAQNKPFWDKYWATSDPAARRALMAARPDLMKKGTSEKALFWQTYVTSDFRTKRSMLREHPERLADIKNRDPKKADMAWAYENLAPYERKKYFSSKGYTLDKVMTNQDYIDLRKEDQAKKDRDVAFYPTLAANKNAFKSSITSSVKKKIKQGTKVTWEKSKKVVDKPIWKVS